MVVFDANYLVHLFHPDPGEVLNPETGRPVECTKEKIEYLVECLVKAQERVLIPTPVLAELFSLAPDGAADFLSIIQNTYRFVLAPFDPVAAIEAGTANAKAVRKGDKRSGLNAPWAKVKFDRQIVAIAKTQSARTIYSNDNDIRTLAGIENIDVISVWDLPDPPPRQSDFDFGEHDTDASAPELERPSE